MLQGHYQKKYEPLPQEPQRAQPQAPTLDGHETRVVRQSQLASTNFATGESSLNLYKQDSSAPEVISLLVQNLPPHTCEKDVKKVSGSKHVVSCTVAYDNMSGQCNGSARI